MACLASFAQPNAPLALQAPNMHALAALTHLQNQCLPVEDHALE